MTISVQNNPSALLALQNLNRTNDQLAIVQGRVSSGLTVANPKDNASVWAIAQGQRADMKALDAVKSSLNRASSISDVALSAGESISDLLNTIKTKVVAAQDGQLDPESLAALNNDFRGLLNQISNVVRNASFDGANVLDGSLTPGMRFLANADTSSYLTLSSKNLTLSGSIVTLATTASITTPAGAAAALSQVEASISNVNTAMSDMGAQARQIDAHNIFISKLNDVLESGLGSLVDADMAREGARLQALQVQQQLGVQSLSIANSAPQSILSLFRS
jgi:flagellin